MKATVDLSIVRGAQDVGINVRRREGRVEVVITKKPVAHCRSSRPMLRASGHLVLEGQDVPSTQNLLV